MMRLSRVTLTLNGVRLASKHRCQTPQTPAPTSTVKAEGAATGQPPNILTQTWMRHRSSRCNQQVSGHPAHH